MTNRPADSSPTTFLDDLRIAKPCSASWDEMVGDDRARFCGSCQKNVYDLRFMTRDEAEALLREKGEACVRMARRADGTVVTSDCPVGVSRAAQRKRVAGVFAGGLLAASALLSKTRPAEAQEAPRPVATQPSSSVEVLASSPLFGWVEALVRLFAPAPVPPPAPQPEVMMMGEVAPVMPNPPPPPRMGKIALPKPPKPAK